MNNNNEHDQHQFQGAADLKVGYSFMAITESVLLDID